MATTNPLCPNCSAVMDQMLEDRIRSILQIGKTDDQYPAESHCFHLMELQRIIRGEKTCGVYDNYGESNGNH